jgi:hypothetical protein
VDVGSVADVSTIRYASIFRVTLLTSAPLMEAPHTSKTLSTLSTSTRCKTQDPIRHGRLLLNNSEVTKFLSCNLFYGIFNT